MGWKTVKEYYKIGHIVHVEDGKLLIGSQMCTHLFEFDMKGKFIKGALCGLDEPNELFPWREAIKADSESGKLGELLATEDKFENLVTVWTFNREKIIEKQAEKCEWPNCCTDGELIENNTHFTSRKKAEEALLSRSIYAFGAFIERMDAEIDDLQSQSACVQSSFMGLVHSLGLEKKLDFQLEQIEALRKRRHLSTCMWKRGNGHNLFATQCGRETTFNEHNATFCPFCGQQIIGEQ